MDDIKRKKWRKWGILTAWVVIILCFANILLSFLVNRWTSYSGTGINIFGMGTLCGHGRPDKIFYVNEDELNEYVDSLIPDRRLNLYRLFASKNPKKIDDEVSRILNHNLDKN